MGQREPVPVLREDEHSDDGLQIGVASAGLQSESDVAATSVDDSLGQNSAKLRHGVFVLAADDLRVQLTEESDFWASLVSVLNQNHGGRNLWT